MLDLPLGVLFSVHFENHFVTQLNWLFLKILRDFDWHFIYGSQNYEPKAITTIYSISIVVDLIKKFKAIMVYYIFSSYSEQRFKRKINSLRFLAQNLTFDIIKSWDYWDWQFENQQTTSLIWNSAVHCPGIACNYKGVLRQFGSSLTLFLKKMPI